MGVKNLNKFLKKKCPQCIKKRSLKDFSNKTVVIDISLYLHKFYSMQGQLFTGLFHQVELLLKNKITPCYIFDGKYDELKTNSLPIYKL